MTAPPIIFEQLAPMEEEERMEPHEPLLAIIGDEDEEPSGVELAQLLASIARGEEDIQAGRVHDAAEVLRELRSRRSPAR